MLNRDTILDRARRLLNRDTILQQLRQLWRWLALDGRLGVAQPWPLLLGPIALLIALVAPYRGLFWIAYTYLLLVLASYAWVRVVGPQVRLRVPAGWASRYRAPSV